MHFSFWRTLRNKLKAKMGNGIILLIAKMDVEIFKLILEGMKDCLEKDGDHESLLLFRDNEGVCYYITDKQIFKDCVNENLAPGLFWGNQELANSLSKNLLSYRFEGNVALLGWSHE